MTASPSAYEYRLAKYTVRTEFERGLVLGTWPGTPARPVAEWFNNHGRNLVFFLLPLLGSRRIEREDETKAGGRGVGGNGRELDRWRAERKKALLIVSLDFSQKG